MSVKPQRRKRRIILVNDNIRDISGRSFEMATLLLNGAQRLDYQPVLATNVSFDKPKAVDPSWKLHTVFHTSGLARWSMGPGGNSNFQRDLSGKTIGGGFFDKLQAMKLDLIGTPANRPRKMLEQWSDDFASLVSTIKPTSADTLLISAGDDFTLLALAGALNRVELTPMRIDVIFQDAVYGPQQPDKKQRLKEVGRQIRDSLKALKPHKVHLHATTSALAAQLRETECGVRVTSIPYPTRSREIVSRSTKPPLKVMLASSRQDEPSKKGISTFLTGVEKAFLRDGSFRIAMQMPEDGWQSMVPSSLHRAYQISLDKNSPNEESETTDGNTSSLLEIKPEEMTPDNYHQWLDTADLGVFLYKPERYLVRSSSTLLNLMIRGIPVIVPDQCSLAEQVRVAGGHRSLGFIYQHRDEIPGLMRQFLRHRDKIQTCATKYVQSIAKQHDRTATLAKMGIQHATSKRSVA